ncbi:MAG: hypothetical protein H8E15_10025 [Planctomycetes bacterium]|nr:hypothetical protein [Planctomycetota bacterium]
MSHTQRVRNIYRSAPLPISLPALGMLVQAIVFWFAVMLASATFSGVDELWYLPRDHPDIQSIILLSNVFVAANIMWAAFICFQIRSELILPKAQKRIRRARLSSDIMALVLALSMIPCAHQLKILVPQEGGRPPSGILEFHFQPEDGVWQYIPPTQSTK